ncbi:Scarecrow-like protein 29 [Forsythia ovata]|uniref:Scarecrow-like protein 29 n=1 Tax=Forsythia ovata TaxID=205694 RepID=A0ABD1WZJ5_9LAMI
MIIGELELYGTSEDILGCICGSSYFPKFSDDPFEDGDFTGNSWWVHYQSLEHESIDNTVTVRTAPADLIISNQPLPSDLPKKRIVQDDMSPKTSQSSRKNHNRQINNADDGFAIAEHGVLSRKSTGSKKATKKSAGNNSNNGNNKEGRWAEHLLNPCATAITVQNPSRVQHFLYVLRELSSLTGNANHRLAAHGLHALTHHISSSGISSASAGGSTFASSNPEFFKDSLINFNDISPWFRIPNNIANTSILQILAGQDQPSNLHILDIGGSHGVQWPTLLVDLSRRSGGPPPLVRLTVVTPSTDSDQLRSTPFANGPPNYDFSSYLLAFAKSNYINLQINKLENIPLQNLNSQVINSSSVETLVICAQFSLHNLNHNTPDERTAFLRILKSLEPKGVILSENNIDCSCKNCGDFATGFSRRVEYLWRFLDSTSVAYKGRESEERRMMEAEAAKALINTGEMNERKEKWCERMSSAGFIGEVLGEETINGAKALLRKYDNNWEIRVEEKDGCISLWWKEQPVSFCSLWKIDLKVNDN